MAKDVLFFFVEENGQVRQIVNGVVTSLATRTALPQAPGGSNDISIGWERSAEYHGNIRNFSLPLSFYMDGAKILRNDAYKYNVDRILYLLILRYVSEMTTLIYKDYYKFLYKGQLDFSTFEDKQGDSEVSISIIEGGLQKLLKAGSGIQFDIPLDTDGYIFVKMDGLAIKNIDNYFVPQQSHRADAVGMNQKYGLSWLYTTFVNSEGTITNGAAFSTGVGIEIQGNISLNDSANPDNYFFINGSTTASFTVRIQAKITVTLDFGKAIQLYIKNSNGSRWPLFILGDYSGIGIIAQAQTYDINTFLLLAPGEKLYLLSEVVNAPPFTATATYNEFDLKVSFASQLGTTYIKAFPPLVLYKLLGEKIGISQDKMVSDTLANCTYCITSGDGLRGLSKAGLKTKMQDFFKAFDVYLMAGMAVENDILRFENRSHFFQPNSITPATELGESKNMVITEAKDQMFSSIKIGHQEQTIDDVNGKLDFNGYHIYTSPEKTVTKELDLQSSWKAGPMEIEITRINFDGKTTTDNLYDNNLFVIDVDRLGIPDTYNVQVSFTAAGNIMTAFVGVVNPLTFLADQKILITSPSVINDGIRNIVSVSPVVLGSQNIILDGTIVDEASHLLTIKFISGQVFNLKRDISVTQIFLDDDGNEVGDLTGIFNVALSPDRLLEVHFPWLKSFLPNFGSQFLTFASTNRNKELIAGGLIQKRDISINDMSTPMTGSFYIEFGTEVPIDLVDTLETNINKPFACNWNNNRYTGFLFKAAIAPNSRVDQVYTLLLDANVDVTNLII